jgi:hypothetical protein
MTEKTLQANILKALAQEHPQVVWARANVATLYSGAGQPDIDGCCCGLAFYGEVKLPGGKPTAIQAAVMRKIEAAGGRCYLWTSVKQAVSDIQNLKKFATSAAKQSRSRPGTSKAKPKKTGTKTAAKNANEIIGENSITSAKKICDGPNNTAKKETRSSLPSSNSYASLESAVHSKR